MEVVPALAAGISAGLAVAVPLGAMGVLLVTTATRVGRREALAGAAGIATADLVFATTAAVGGTTIAALLEPYIGAARVVAAIVLLVIAGWMLRSGLREQPIDSSGPQVRAGGSFGRFLGLTLLNPATIVTFAGVIVVLPSEVVDTTVERAAFVLGTAGASMAWQALLAGAGLVTSRLLGPSARRITAVVGASAIAVLAVVALVG